MADEELRRKVEEHGKAIQGLEVQQQLNSKILEQHADEFRRMNRESSLNHGETMTKISDLSDKVSMVIDDFHERRGASKVIRIYLPIGLTVIGTALAYLAFLE